MTPTAMVFVIDDDASMRKSLERLLDAAEYKAELFKSASEFLARSAHPGPSCVVVDVRMPELNGIDFQKALIEGGREEQLVFITGHGDVPMCAAKWSAALSRMKAGRSSLSMGLSLGEAECRDQNVDRFDSDKGNDDAANAINHEIARQ